MERKLLSSLKITACNITKAALLLILVNINQPLFAQASASFRTLKHIEPTKIEDYDLPKPVLNKIKSFKPEDINRLDEEIHQRIKTETGEKIVNLRIRFNDDYIIGFYEDPSMSVGTSTSDLTIVVPVEFVCTTTKDHEKQHTARLSEIKGIEEKEKCTGWHQANQPAAAVQSPAPNYAPKQSQKIKRKNNGDGVSAFDKTAIKVIGMATFVFVAAAVR